MADFVDDWVVKQAQLMLEPELWALIVEAESANGPDLCRLFGGAESAGAPDLRLMVKDAEQMGGTGFRRIIEDARLVSWLDLCRVIEEGWQAAEAAQDAPGIVAAVDGKTDPTPEQDAPHRARGALAAITLEDLLARPFGPRGHVIDPVIPERGLTMLYAPRGCGKTFMALAIAYAAASGGEALGRWSAPTPRRTLYLDGEMPAVTMRERLGQIARGAQQALPPGNFLLVTPDLVDGPLPNLAEAMGQLALAPLLDGVELIVVDNLAALVKAKRDNDTDSWLPMQGWLLAQRRAGRSVLLVHHAGKGGDQRGSSAKEDVLDVVVKLSRPPNYRPDEGARAVVELTKARGIFGKASEPFEASLVTTPGGGLLWVATDLTDARARQVAELKALGLTLREIAAETGIPRSTVARLASAQTGTACPTARRGAVGQWDKTRSTLLISV